jgi:rRNA-processing protein FCF1
MGEARSQAIVFDAGALIAFERGNPRIRALVREMMRTGTKLVVPAGVVAQVIRDRRRQVALNALLDHESSVVPVIDRALAEAIGTLCGRVGTSDIVDASVVLVARRERATVVTSDSGDLRALDPTLKLERI